MLTPHSNWERTTRVAPIAVVALVAACASDAPGQFVYVAGYAPPVVAAPPVYYQPPVYQPPVYYAPQTVVSTPVLAYRPVVASPYGQVIPTTPVFGPSVAPPVAFTPAVYGAPVITTRYRPILGGSVSSVRYYYGGF